MHAAVKKVWKYRVAYLFLIPAIVWYFIFCYMPMYGVLLGFKDFRFDLGIWGSPWAGTRYLNIFLTHHQFWPIIRNTLVISGLRLFVGFPAAIILALMLNEVTQRWFKKLTQTVLYLPFFVSWVVVVTLFNRLLSPHGGVVNDLLGSLFGKDPIFFMGERDYFYPLVTFAHVWKNLGWSTIIYLAALSFVNPELYEAAMIDGAGKLKMIWHITLPSMKFIMGINIILSLGSLMHVGFEQIYLMQTPGVMAIAEILDTHVLRQGLQRGQFSYATIVGLFQSFIGLILVVTANGLSKKFTEVSLF